MPRMQKSPRERLRDEGRVNFQIWLTGEEAVRYCDAWDAAKKRQPYADSGAINRRLLGLNQDGKLLTNGEVKTFRDNGGATDIDKGNDENGGGELGDGPNKVPPIDTLPSKNLGRKKADKEREAS